MREAIALWASAIAVGLVIVGIFVYVILTAEPLGSECLS